MSTQQAFVNGFIKRASQYGYSEQEAINILKQADEYVATEPTRAQKARVPMKPSVPVKPTIPVKPAKPVTPPRIPNYPGEADANDVAGYGK
jgi:hypothetical protein